MKDTVRVKILRRKDRGSRSYWEEFEVPYSTSMNVITLLMEIQKRPVRADGEKTDPVVWECNCLEEVCGACTMVINGIPGQACSALVDQLKQPVVLKPLSKFPVTRDLAVDRNSMFENLKRIKGWLAIDGFHDLGQGPKLSKSNAAIGYRLSRCMTCGCCMESCPQVNTRTSFIGPAPIAQARFFNIHPTGQMRKDERLAALIGDGGINECGNAQNCERVCPKELPLLSSIAEMNRKVIEYFFRNICRH